MTLTATHEKPVGRRNKSASKKKNPAARLLAVIQETVKEDDGQTFENFSDHSKCAAEQSGCRYLFEMPSVLITEKPGTATAFLYNNSKKCQLFFLIYSASTKKVSMVGADEAPEKVVEFAWSYTKVLSLLSQVNSEAIQ